MCVTSCCAPSKGSSSEVQVSSLSYQYRLSVGGHFGSLWHVAMFTCLSSFLPSQDYYSGKLAPGL